MEGVGVKLIAAEKTLAPVVVDANSYGLMQLIHHIAANFIWGFKTIYHIVWFKWR
jgi:hypothetical protein